MLPSLLGCYSFIIIIFQVCKGGCGDKPGVWIDSGIHAREWIGPAVGTWMLRELVENNFDHPDLTERLDWYFLPVLNADGYHLSRQNNKTRFWRKSTSGNPSVGNELSMKNGTNKFGVDLNRNFDYLWGTTGHPSLKSNEYPGPAVFSEVETRNVRDFILPHKDQIKLFISLHSFGQLILTPGNKSVAASKKVEDLAREANNALESVNGEPYTIGCGESLLSYPLSGDTADWAYWTVGIPYAYTIELRPTLKNGIKRRLQPTIKNRKMLEKGLRLPEDQIIPNAKEVWAWHKVAARTIIDEFGPFFPHSEQLQKKPSLMFQGCLPASSTS